MIKFFRRFRQQLLSENKFSKYLIYAVGEIILVVIGILIAVQINTWNENRKSEIANTQLIQKLEKELQLNKDRLTDLKSSQNGYENRLKRNDSIKAVLFKGATIADLDLLIKNFYMGNTLNLHTSTYEEMKNTGKLYTLGSEALINEIELYYTLCERESYYVLEINSQVYKHVNQDINSGWLKLKQDYYAQGAEFTIKDNSWLFNKETKEYNGLIRLIDFANFYLGNIDDRIQRLIEASEKLQIEIKKELK